VNELFKTLYRESPLAKEEDFNDKVISKYLKSDEEDHSRNISLKKVLKDA